MAFGRIIDVWVDAPFEDVPVVCWTSGRIASRLCQLDIQKGRNMAQVEDASVAQLDGLFVELLVWEHLTSDDVPRSPKRLPILD